MRNMHAHAGNATYVRPRESHTAQLMKKLRTAKVANGTKDEKKKVTSELDASIHKLLGPV